MDHARTVLFTLDSSADNEAGVIFDGKNADKLSKPVDGFPYLK